MTPRQTAIPAIFTLSLHDALPISVRLFEGRHVEPAVCRGALSHQLAAVGDEPPHQVGLRPRGHTLDPVEDRKSTRLNSSHLVNSYAVFCLKKKKKEQEACI